MTHPSAASLARIRYDRETGEFYWIEGPRTGRRADHLNGQGYRRISLEGKWHSAHRIAWLIETGDWPMQIDHADLDRPNNKFSNLRLANNSLNQANTEGRGALAKGVTLHRSTGKYQAQIKSGGKSFYLGLFSSESEANAAYSGAAKVLFGKFARTGRAA